MARTQLSEQEKKEEIRKYRTLYYYRNREKILARERKRYQRDKLKRRAYYNENKERIIEQQKAYQKRINYATQKTPEARATRNIRSKTRHDFPIGTQGCEAYGCGKRATDRHHITKPIEYDKFLFLCHDHHVAIHRGDPLKFKSSCKEVLNGRNRSNKNYPSQE